LYQYDIYLGAENIGQAQVSEEGLYYCFHCICTLQAGIMYRVIVRCGGHHENLGILVPEGGQYTLTKKIPVKRLASREFQFHVMPKHQETRGKFIAVYPEEPFGYIRKLENAYLKRVNGSLGVVIQE
jgi:hypothetical protein